MNRIHRKVEYALISLKHMSTKPKSELTTVKEICRTYGTPFDATSRVLQALVQNLVVKSEQGAHGGYYILQDLKKITLLSLIELLVGPVELVKCLSQSKSVDCQMISSCNVTVPLTKLNKRLRNFYSEIFVSELLGDSGAGSNMEASI